MKRYAIELLGTFAVVLAITLTENPMAIGFVYLSMLYIGARISGAHYNPVITQALWLRGKCPTYRLPGYFIAQLIGACLAIGLEYYLSGSLFVPDISSDDTLSLICLLELLFTFVICYLYLVVFTVPMFKQTQLYGIILGLSLIGLISMGGLFNPAIGCAAFILNILLAGAPIHLGYGALVYIICPLIGSAMAGFVFDYLEAPASGEFVSVDSY